MNEPTPVELVIQESSTTAPDHTLATRYAPIINFDAREPFLPSLVGYTIFRESAPSPSFSRQIHLDEAGRTQAPKVIEYAIWWDWDIQHLYELEHVWVYVNAEEHVIHAEASWHGSYHSLALNGHLSLTGDRVTLFAEPGKHAFAPAQEWLVSDSDRIRQLCRYPGKKGVWVTSLFEGVIHDKSPDVDRLVQEYLEQFAFDPSFEFTQIFPIAPDHLVSWPRLFEWIPRRVTWWVAQFPQRFQLSAQ
jgi:hypothetical protein